MPQSIPATTPLAPVQTTVTAASPNVAPKSTAVPVVPATTTAPATTATPDPKKGADVKADPAATTTTPAEPKGMSFTERAKAQSKLVAQQRAAREEQARIGANARQLEQQRQQIVAEEKLLRENPSEWMAKRMTNDQITNHFKNGGKLTTEQELEAMKERLDRSEKEKAEVERRQKISEYQGQVNAAADEFVTWVQQDKSPFLALSAWPDADVKSAFIGIQQRAAQAGVSYTKKEIAKFLDDYLAPHAKKVAERFGTKPNAEARATADASTTTKVDENGKGATRTLSALTTETALPAVDYSKLSKKEKVARMADEYRALVGKKGP